MAEEDMGIGRTNEAVAVGGDAKDLPPRPDLDTASSAFEYGQKPHGPYIITPDSAPPVPTKMVADIDVDVVVGSVAAIEEKQLKVYEEYGGGEGRSAGFFHVTATARASLLRLAGTSMASALDVLDAADRDTGFHDESATSWTALARPV